MTDSQPSVFNANTSTVFEKEIETVVPNTPQQDEITSKSSINIHFSTEQEKKSLNDVDEKVSRDL